ncbi:MAG: T9SS type A sorting domain-containing protein [Candidatus Kapaibacterium sp.]
MAQWSGEASPPILAFGVHDTNLFVSVDNRSYPWNLVYRISPFVPRTWTGADAGMDASQGLVTSFASLGKYFFAGMTNSSGGHGPGWQSSDNGSNWVNNSGSPVFSNGRYLFSSSSTTVYRSTDTGRDWVGVPCVGAINFAAMGINVFANTGGAIWRSEDTGNNWSQIHPPIVGAMVPMDSILFIVGNGELAKSTDSGTSWSMVTVDSGGVPWYLNVMATDGKNLFAGTKQGILVSTDTGHSWQAQNDGILDKWQNNSISVTAIAVFDTLVFIDVTSSRPTDTYYALYDRPISELTAKSAVAQVQQPGDTIEVYPNPASGVVSIRSGGTTILGVRVLNVLGENMLSIPNTHFSDISLDLSKLPSGTYFLRIQTSEGNVLRKIVKE